MWAIARTLNSSMHARTTQSFFEFSRCHVNAPIKSGLYGTNFRRSKIDDIHKTMIPKENSARSSTLLVHKPKFFNFCHPPRCRFSSFQNSKPSHYRYTIRRNRQMEWKIGTKLQRPLANSGNVDDGVRFQHNFHSQIPGNATAGADCTDSELL
jgi:hypothetical protein